MSKARNLKSKIMWIWHAAVVAEYQKPLAELAHYTDLDLTLLLPRRWPERAGQMVKAEGPVSSGYRLVKARTAFTGLYYIYFYPTLLYQLLRSRPDVIYCYEEAHTLMAALVLFLRRLFLPRSAVLLYAAQNIRKHYPLPFRLFERYCFRRANAILACGTSVASTLRSKGYRGALHVVPLPTDTAAYSPDPQKREAIRRELDLPADALVVGYAGKLVEEKGLRTLWKAFSHLADDCPNLHLVLMGGGPLKDELQRAANSAGLANRLHLAGVIHNNELPAYLNALDIFVLASETRPNWREQFGRVVVEAMSCGVPVVGSDSGEIPAVIGDAGLIFPEGDSLHLASCLQTLFDPILRADLAGKGRERVLRNFSLETVAAQHYSIYQAMSAER